MLLLLLLLLLLLERVSKTQQELEMQQRRQLLRAGPRSVRSAWQLARALRQSERERERATQREAAAGSQRVALTLVLELVSARELRRTAMPTRTA